MSNIVEVDNLTVSFVVRGGSLLLFERGSGMMNVVNDVSFHVREGETFGLAGETGSGKSENNSVGFGWPVQAEVWVRKVAG